MVGMCLGMSSVSRQGSMKLIRRGKDSTVSESRVATTLTMNGDKSIRALSFAFTMTEGNKPSSSRVKTVSSIWLLFGSTKIVYSNSPQSSRSASANVKKYCSTS